MFSSLDHFEITEIEVFVSISLSPFYFANVCSEHWHLVTWLWRVVLGLYRRPHDATLGISATRHLTVDLALAFSKWLLADSLASLLSSNRVLHLSCSLPCNTRLDVPRLQQNLALSSWRPAPLTGTAAGRGSWREPFACFWRISLLSNH